MVVVFTKTVRSVISQKFILDAKAVTSFYNAHIFIKYYIQLVLEKK